MAKSKSKSKGKGKAKGKKRDGEEKKKNLKPVPEGLALNEMSKKQLRKHIMKLFKEIDREREERNFFMLEGERQFLLWNMILEQITQEKERIRLLEVKFDDAEREKEKAMNVYKQKLRFMMGEQTQKLGQARLVNLYTMKRIQDEIWEITMMLRDAAFEKRQQWRVMRWSMYGILQTLRQTHSDEVAALRQEFADEVKRMSQETERKADAERKRIHVQNSVELANIRATKEEQIDHMLYMHEKQLLEMKTFFNDLEVNNMAVITSLQQEIALKKLNEIRLQQSLKDTKDKYESLLVPLDDSEVKMTIEWVNDDQEIQKVRNEIEIGKKQLTQNNRYIRLMSCANESLLQKSHYIEHERDLLRNCFTKSIINGHKRATMNRMITGLRNRISESFPFNQGSVFEKRMKSTGKTKVPIDSICSTFQPIFMKPPFQFNECVFPDLNTESNSLCQEYQYSPRRKQNVFMKCDSSHSDIHNLQSTFSQPFRKKSSLGFKLLESVDE